MNSPSNCNSWVQMTVTDICTCVNTQGDSKTTTKCSIDSTFWSLHSHTDAYQHQNKCAKSLFKVITTIYMIISFYLNGSNDNDSVLWINSTLQTVLSQKYSAFDIINFQLFSRKLNQRLHTDKHAFMFSKSRKLEVLIL